VVITVAGSDRICPLLDLSENGAAFEWPEALVPAIGDRLASLNVRFDSHVSYRGEARVGSLREIDGATIVGVFRNGLTLIGVEVIYQYLVTGILVILAVSVDQLTHRRRA